MIQVVRAHHQAADSSRLPNKSKLKVKIAFLKKKKDINTLGFPKLPRKISCSAPSVRTIRTPPLRACSAVTSFTAAASLRGSTNFFQDAHLVRCVDARFHLGIRFGTRTVSSRTCTTWPQTTRNKWTPGEGWQRRRVQQH